MADHDTLRIVQLNAGSLLEPGWADRRHELVAWLRRLEADVVCLQEVWEDANTSNTARWLVDAAPELGYHFTFGGDSFDAAVWPDPSMRFGSAVLSRWPIDQSNYHRLPTAPSDDPFVDGVPWELLHARTADLDVFSCHLAPAPTHGLHRQVQVLAIDEIIRSVRGERDVYRGGGHRREAMPPILCGDFNADPESDEMRFLCSQTALDGRTAYFQDAWRLEGSGSGFTQDWRRNSIAASMNVARKRIDYVLVGDPFQRRGHAGRVLAAELAFHEQLTGVHASDHFGLAVDVIWPHRPH